MQEEKVEEGTVILDPELKKKSEKFITVNNVINNMIKELDESYGVKVLIGGSVTEYNELGVWKTKSLSTIEEMGLSKLIGNQF